MEQKNIKSGDMLEELTDKLNNESISKFVSTGPKSLVLNTEIININLV